ncbi:MAG: glucosyl-3-phosphoglycerate synthase [Solirubrobacteraceae bacterium]|jgi:glycosyltransferase involved in cell wall biosynthesis
MSPPRPDRRLQAIVVVPAHDEQDRIGLCLRALAEQRGVDAASFEVVVVLDRCSDDTRAVVSQRATATPRPRLILLDSPRPGSGHARRAGMDFACARLLGAGRPHGLIASTDADTRVAPDWLATQLALARDGAGAIGGRIDLDPREASRLPPAVLHGRKVHARARHARIRAFDQGATAMDGRDHHQFSGASLAVTAQIYRDLGGLPVVDALEDEAFERLLEDRRIPIVRSDRVSVTTSARTNGRAARGLARDLALADWRARRSFRASEFDPDDLLARKTASISVILPAREVGDTIAPIVGSLVALRETGLIDELIVIDAASRDGTAAIAAAQGADVLQEDELLSEHGPSRGKGDAMWRALSVVRGEIAVFLDADTRDFTPTFVIGLLGPLLSNPEIRFVKGAFRRPLALATGVLPGEGGRVTELVARPLLNLYAPHLAGFDQPLAGEVAAYSSLLRSVRFPAGYGVEIANLIDIARLAGMDGLAQVDLGERQNRHQPLRDLSAMAYAVMVAAASRLGDSGLHAPPAPGPLALPPRPGDTAPETRQVVVLERPPLASLTSDSPDQSDRDTRAGATL